MLSAGLCNLQVNRIPILRNSELLAKAGLGLAFMPMYEAWEAIKNGELQEVTIETHAPSLPITALYQDRQYTSKKIKVLLAFLHSYLSESLKNIGTS